MLDVTVNDSWAALVWLDVAREEMAGWPDDMTEVVPTSVERPRLDLGVIVAINSALWLVIWLVVFVALSL